jgi:hypothetical protein
VEPRTPRSALTKDPIVISGIMGTDGSRRTMVPHEIPLPISLTAPIQNSIANEPRRSRAQCVAVQKFDRLTKKGTPYARRYLYGTVTNWKLINLTKGWG